MRNTTYGNPDYRNRAGFRKKLIFIPFLVVGGIALVSYIVMLLWNALMPDIFHLGVISFWQAAGLLALSKIFFGFGPKGGRGGAPWMRHKMERFKNMSPEEQQQFREQMRERCGKWGGRFGHQYWEQTAGTEPQKADEDTNIKS